MGLYIHVLRARNPNYYSHLSDIKIPSSDIKVPSSDIKIPSSDICNRATFRNIGV